MVNYTKLKKEFDEVQAQIKEVKDNAEWHQVLKELEIEDLK